MSGTRRVTPTMPALSTVMAIAAGISIVALVPPARAGEDTRQRDGDLRRQPYLGLRILPLEEENAKRLGLAEARGVWVQVLVGDSPAGAAGLAIDDVIVSVNDRETDDLTQFMGAMSPLRAGDTVRFGVLRGQLRTRVALELPPLPVEMGDGLDIAYGAFPAADGVRLRALFSRPKNVNGTRLPALLLIQGHVGESVESGAYNAYREIAHGLSRRGYGVLRFDRRGVGDSEGRSYLDTDLWSEVADAEAALRYLRSRDDVDPAQVYVFGTGLGGTVAAIVADRNPEVRGVLVAGSIGRPWIEYVLESNRDHRRRAGQPLVEINDALEILSRFFALIGEGESMEAILKRHPGWAREVLDFQGRPYGRSAAFFAQLTSINPARIYERLRCPVVVLYGASDFVALQTDQEAIEAALTAGGNPDHVLFVLPEVDHAFAYAPSRDESYANWQTGQVFFNPDALDPIATWLDGRTGRR